MADFEARSRSSRGSPEGPSESSSSGIRALNAVAHGVPTDQPSTALVLASQGSVADSHPPRDHGQPSSPQHLSSFLGSPETDMQTETSLGASPIPHTRQVYAHQHHTTQSRDQALHLHQTNTLNQDVRIQQNVMQVAVDPEVQAQAFAVVQQAANEVNIARRQTVEVAARAAQELEAQNHQTREALTQAERQVMQARFVAEHEVVQARQATMVAQAAQQRSEQMLTIAKTDFDRMQGQMNSLEDVIQQQRVIIQQLQSQRAETKQPSNGTEHPVMQQCTRDNASSSAMPSGTNENGPILEPKRGVCPEVVGGGDFGVEFSPVICSLDTPRPRIDPSVQHQLDLLSTQIASLASAVSALTPGGGGCGNAPSSRGAAATPPRSAQGSREVLSGLERVVPSLPSSPGSSSSSSSGESKKGKKGKGTEKGSSSSSSSSSVGSVEAIYKREKKLMRVKDYSSFKVSHFPKNAAEARGFKNHLFSSIARLAKGDEAPILEWMSKCTKAEGPEAFEDSGDYPLLDRILGHRMLELAKGTKFSLDFQTLQESAQKKGKQPKGRHLVWVILQKFRLEKDRGTSLTQHHLLSLTISGSDAKGLDEFRQKFNYILEALEVDERPTDVGIRSLMYEQLKNHPKMSLHIDRYRNSSANSNKRTWRWLYQKMCEVIEISQLDENTMAIDKALSSNARVNAAPNPARKQEDAQNEKEKKDKEKQKEKEKSKEKQQREKKEKDKRKQEEKKQKEARANAEAETPASPAPPKGKGKGKSPRTPKTKEEKGQLPCMYYAYNCCKAGDKCEYLHDKNRLYDGPRPRGVKTTSAGVASVMAGAAVSIGSLPTSSAQTLPPSDCDASNAPVIKVDDGMCELGRAASVAPACRGNSTKRTNLKGRRKSTAFHDARTFIRKGVSFSRLFTTMMAATSCFSPLSNPPACAGLLGDLVPKASDMEYLIDSGAGRNLISKSSLPEEAHDLFEKAPEKLKFSTGGGVRSGSDAIRIQGSITGNNVFYALKDCPPALSLGIQVNEHKRAWVWFPDRLPFFIKPECLQDVTFHCPESARIYADKVVQNVPILKESITCSGLPASATAESKGTFAGPFEPASSSSDPAPVALRRIAKGRGGARPPEASPDDGGSSRGAPVAHFGDGDELEGCVAPEKIPDDEPLDEEDAEAYPWTPSLREKLQAIAKSPEHQITHFPKNRYCDICRRAKMTSRSHRYHHGEADPEETPPLHFGHKLRADHIIINDELSKGSEGEQACLICFDEFSGCFGAYPQTRRTTQSNVACLRHFGGTRAHGKALCQVKSDSAPELTDAVKELNWLPEPGIPNDAFHNAKLERGIRSIKEGTRSVHLRAGFPHALWPRSVEYLCTAKAFTTKAPVHPNETEESEAFKEGKTCYEVANKGDTFRGLKVPLGALVYYKPAKHKDLPPFDPRTLPGIFCGWRIDHGFRFRGIHLVLDYESLRTNQKGCGRPIQVHEKELVVPDSFVFPLYEANALKLTSLSPKPSLPKIEPGESLPFEKGAPDPEVRKRRTYVTLERAIRFGKTMGCRGCDRIAEGVKHSDACHDRFAKLLEDERKAKLLEEERKAKEKRDATPPAAEGDAIPAAPSVQTAQKHLPTNQVREALGSGSNQDEHDYWSFDEQKGAWKRVHVRPRKRLFTPMTKNYPFDMCTVSEGRETQWKCRGKVSVYEDNWQQGSPNRRISSKSWTGVTWFFPKQPLRPEEAKLRAAISNAADQQKRVKPPPKGIDAVASIVHCMSSVTEDPEAMKALAQKVGDAAPKAPPRKSLPKGTGSETMFEFCCDPKSMLGQVNESFGINHFRVTAKSSNMADPVQGESLRELVAQFPGCDLWGSVPDSPWNCLQHPSQNLDKPGSKKKLKGQRRLSIRMLKNFIKVAEQVLSQGGTVSFEWPKNCSGWKLPLLLEFIARHGLYEAITDGCAFGIENHLGDPLKKSWRVVTSSFKLAQNLSAKRGCHQSGFKHAEISGKIASSSALHKESMARCIAQSLYSHILDSHVPCMPTVPAAAAEHVPNELSSEQQKILAGVHMLIDRKDWHKHPGAQEAIDKEASGLLSNDTWSYDEVVSREELMRSKTPLNIGRVMTILSMKHWETPELRKLKARIVFRGDDIRDENNNLAVLQGIEGESVRPNGHKLQPCVRRPKGTQNHTI